MEKERRERLTMRVLNRSKMRILPRKRRDLLSMG